MTLIFALAVGVLFGAGAYLLLQPDLIRVVVGVVLISHAANVALLSAGRGRGAAPIAPFEGTVSDPLVQAMTVTAIVIGFATAALLFSIVYRVYRSHDTVDLDDLARAEAGRGEPSTRDEDS